MYINQKTPTEEVKIFLPEKQDVAATEQHSRVYLKELRIESDIENIAFMSNYFSRGIQEICAQNLYLF